MTGNKIFLLILIALAIPLIGLQAQEKNDTIVKTKKKKEKPVYPEPYHWNVIKFNPTPMLLTGIDIRNLTFTYERLVKKNQSVSLQVGYLVFPRIADTIAGIFAMRSGTKKGINIAFDYRYYPLSRNRRPAPDGIYIGGYLSYYGFQFQNDINFTKSDIVQNGKMKGKLNVVNLGVDLGYQFIFWKRFSLDLLLFGPAVSYYSGNLSIEGELDKAEIENIDQEVVDKLLSRFPLLKSIFSGETLKFTGNRANFNIGFRYCIQLGFHF
jgi:hypothetical protein